MKNKVKFNKKVLFLTEDNELLSKQLVENIELNEDINDLKLIDNISTDEISPGWVCLRYDQSLGDYSLIGLRNKLIKEKTLKNSDFEVLVSGKSKGCGSSREHAPYSEKYAGIKLVVAKSFEKIYHQNCHNIGLLTSTDFSIIEKIKKGEELDIKEFTKGLNPINKLIVEHGGLFEFSKARLENKTSIPLVNRDNKAMTLVEKIVARKAKNLDKTKKSSCVQEGDTLLCNVDVRFSHDYVTAMMADLFYSNFGKDSLVKNKESIFAFRDHLTFADDILAKKNEALVPLAQNLANKQRKFAKEQNIKLYDELKTGGSKAICHNAIIEDIAMPNDIIIGTDSHTCTAGALGTFAFGVGSTEMANAYYTNDIFICVPKSIKIELTNSLASNVSAKDLVLHLMNDEYLKSEDVIGKVIEYSGEGISSLSIDERATLTNMAVEMGAMTAIVAIDELAIEFLKENREEVFDSEILKSDEDASYAYSLKVDLSKVEAMIAMPGDPRNAITFNSFNSSNSKDKTKIDIAYGGSCTGGKVADIEMYAEVVKYCLENDISLNSKVDCFIQFGSIFVKEYARKKGYLELFKDFGIELIEPSCGACINAGPGVSSSDSQVTISAINRNFPGRSGPGEVYLASPYTVISSAVLGYISDFNLLKDLNNKDVS